VLVPVVLGVPPVPSIGVVVFAVGINPPGALAPIIRGAPVLIQAGGLLPGDSLFAFRPRLTLGYFGLSPLHSGGVYLSCTPMLDCLLPTLYGPPLAAAYSKQPNKHDDDDRHDDDRHDGFSTHRVPPQRSAA
jgi:hypothetical protein